MHVNGPSPRDEVLSSLFQASREVTHAATHLCSVGAALAEADEQALAASLRLARAAFRLDDEAREGPSGPSALRLALQALETAESSIRQARRSLESVALVSQR